MTDQLLSRALHVSDPAVGAVFASSKLRRIVMLFASSPRTVSEAALISGMDLKRLHYHVQKLRRLGLLKVAEERKRAGRPLKLYRACSEVFFIPEEVLPRGFQQELAEELRGCLEHAHTSSRGLLFSLGRDGRPEARRIEDNSRAPSAVDMWRILRLKGNEAEALMRELRALFDRFQETSSGRGEVYLVHAAVARRLAETASVDNMRN